MTCRCNICHELIADDDVITRTIPDSDRWNPPEVKVTCPGCGAEDEIEFNYTEENDDEV